MCHPYIIQCVSIMMTPILTRNSLKVNCTPSLRGNAHETPPHCVETSPQCVKTPTKRSRTEVVELTFREFLVRMGVIIFETHCSCRTQRQSIKPAWSI